MKLVQFVPSVLTLTVNIDASNELLYPLSPLTEQLAPKFSFNFVCAEVRAMSLMTNVEGAVPKKITLGPEALSYAPEFAKPVLRTDVFTPVYVTSDAPVPSFVQPVYLSTYGFVEETSALPQVSLNIAVVSSPGVSGVSGVVGVAVPLSRSIS